jgi:hypothetical protein
MYYIVIWYIFSRFGMLCQEKSGSPVSPLPHENFSEKNLSSWRDFRHSVGDLDHNYRLSINLDLFFLPDFFSPAAVIIVIAYLCSPGNGTPPTLHFFLKCSIDLPF